MRLAFSDFFFGKHHFGDDAPLQDFQHRFLVCTLLACALCVGLYMVLSFQLELPYVEWLRLSWLVMVSGLLGLWVWLRTHPAHFYPVTWGLMVVGISTLLLNIWLNPYNPLLFLWLFSTLLPSFVLLGRIAGWCMALLAITCALVANRYLHTYFTSTSMLTLCLATLCLALQCHFYVSRFQHFFARLQNYSEHLRYVAQYDHLTGVRNAAAYYAQCEQYIRMAQRAERGFAVLFVDLDHFKKINDTHGHAAGDAVLRAVGQSLLQTVRDTDVVGRVGGEEFSILLPDTDCDGAMELAERIRTSIESLQIPLISGMRLQATASVGVSICQDASSSIQSIQREADVAMYQAGATGSRCSTKHPHSPPWPSGFGGCAPTFPQRGGIAKPLSSPPMLEDWNSWGPLALSMAGAAAGVGWAVVRVWRLQRRLPPQHPNAATGRWFAIGFGLAAVLWLAWAMQAGYARFWQPDSDRLWLLAVHADALWSIPLFISAVAWAASVAMGWVFRLLQRETPDSVAPR